MNKGEKHIVEAIAAVIILLFIVNEAGMMTNYGYKPIFPLNAQSPTNPNNGGNTATNYAAGIGMYQLSFQAMNSASSASLSVATDLNIYVLHYVNGQWIPQGGLYTTSSTAYFTATAADDGYMYIEVKPYTTTYYVDYQKILNTEGSPGYITGVQYVNDPLGDGHKDFIFQYSLANQPVPAAGSYPVLTFTAWGLTYDATVPTISTLTNQTGIGATSVPKFYENDITFNTAGDGIAIYKVELVFGNSTTGDTVTDQTKLSLTSMQVPGLGTISGGSFSCSYEASDIRYDYTVATSLYGSDFVMYPLNSNNKFPVNTQIQWNLKASDTIIVTLNIYYFNNAGVGQKMTATFWCNE
jgi:hypothetical protein